MRLLNFFRMKNADIKISVNFTYICKIKLKIQYILLQTKVTSILLQQCTGLFMIILIYMEESTKLLEILSHLPIFILKKSLTLIN